ncbi:dTDP-fucosamine acetyltransferase [Arthrobacter sp. SO5]|uniref:GNAT family N-acetyltransferase n=1 Tax=Arthrobacter sp. SO5 TaxID=1897055 RepID=UPI001E4F927B|nr:GNAT family N-acetyltransferase [Arthrobacter sp. SO5]MCB5274764.1 dTDP-fucosamine acetyltransferase [Arthrobacter sp. SO5]
MIRTARIDDLPRLRAIEAAAGEAFRALGMAAIADDAPPTLEELAVYQRSGRCWVAADAEGTPAGYILVDRMDGNAHIEQVTVHPKHARQGIGRSLIGHAAEWAQANGLARLTLTTFRDVPWNAPYYQRLGFVSVPETLWTDGIRRTVLAEGDHGLDAWPRVVMELPLESGPGRS